MLKRGNIQVLFAPDINSLGQKCERKKFPAPASALDPPHVLCGQRKETQGGETNVIRATQQGTKKQALYLQKETPGKTQESSVQPQGPEEG